MVSSLKPAMMCCGASTKASHGQVCTTGEHRRSFAARNDLEQGSRDMKPSWSSTRSHSRQSSCSLAQYDQADAKDLVLVLGFVRAVSGSEL